jgi:hypothetical protein
MARNRLESGRHHLRRQEGICEDEQQLLDGPRLTKRLVSPDGWKRDQTHVKWYREHLHREGKVKAREEKLEERVRRGNNFDIVCIALFGYGCPSDHKERIKNRIRSVDIVYVTSIIDYVSMNGIPKASCQYKLLIFGISYVRTGTRNHDKCQNDLHCSTNGRNSPIRPRPIAKVT